MSDVDRVELAPGYSVSRIISGCWQLAAGHGGGPATATDVDARLAELVDAGFTTFDCADIYTGVEELLGRFRRSLADPERVQVHTKYVPDRDSLATLRPQDVVAAIDRSLRRLSADRLDLVQFHWWDYGVPGYLDAWHTLGALRDEGKIRLVGVTNFGAAHVGEMIASGTVPASIQLQYSLLDRRPETGMIDLCREYGIALLPYGVLAGGLLSSRTLGTGPPGSPNRSLQKYLLIVEETGGWPSLQTLVEALAGVAARHDATVSAVATRWTLDRAGVGAVILGVGSRSRVDENRTIAGLRLTAEDDVEIGSVLETLPSPSGDVYGLERDAGGPHRQILRMNLSETG